MKIAITSTAPSLDAEVDARFGRCAFFLMVESDDLTFEAIENPNVAAAGGAGVQSAQMVVESGAGAVVTGNCGPNAYRVLTAGGVAVITGAAGPVSAAVEKFKAGAYAAAGEPSVASHFGTGKGGAAGAGAPS